MFTECDGDFRKVLARGTEFVHVPLRPESVRRDRAEIAVFRTEFPGMLIVGAGLVLHARFFGFVRARPGITAIAAENGGGEPRLYGHDGNRDREDLAGAAIVERG